MRNSVFRWSIPFFAVAAVAVSATIAWREASRSKPLYGEVVFGRDADLRLQFIAHGLKLYLDENGDHRAQRSEFLGNAKLDKPLHLKSPTGVQYDVHGGLMYVPQYTGPTRPQALDFNVRVAGRIAYDQYGDVVLSPQPDGAARVHFDGPLAIRERTPNLQFTIGEESTDIRIEVSTYQPETGGWATVYSNKHGNRQEYAFPKNVVPVVEVVFPSNADPIESQFPLDQFC